MKYFSFVLVSIPPIMNKILVIVLILSFSFTGFSQTLKEEYNACAVEKFQIKDYEGAIEYFTRVIEISPKDSMAYFDRAMVKELLHDYKGAIDDYTKQIAIDSGNVDSYFLRGILKNITKDYKSAIIDFTKALKIESDNSDAFYERSIAQLELQNLKEALNDCIEAITLNSANAKYYLQKGKIYISMNQNSNACKEFNKYLELGGEKNVVPISMPCSERK